MVSILYEYVYLCGIYGIRNGKSSAVGIQSGCSFLSGTDGQCQTFIYGLSMLDKYKNTGWKKFYLIFGMCDESFTVNCTVTPPDDVDRGWFMFFVNLLNQIYWVFAATAGALLGYVIHFDTTGIEFVMTALFVVMFLNQWEESKDHLPALVGLICSAICLLIFGSSNFIVPSMIFIIVAFTAERRFSKKPEVAAK